MKAEENRHLQEEIREYADLARIVNPENKSLQVLYPGSGGDILVPLAVTNSDTFVFVEEYTLKEGFSGPHTTRILKEAKSLKVDKITIEDYGQEAHISLDYTHPNDVRGSSRHRDIRFYARDYFKYWPDEYTDGYDVLIAKGESPNFNTHDIQMKQLIEKMRLGGYFISDRDIAWIIPAELLGFRAVDTKNLHFAGGPARVHRKVAEIQQNTASDLFRIDDLLRASLDARDYTSYYEPVILGERPDILEMFPWLKVDELKDHQDRNALKLQQKLKHIADIITNLPEHMRVEIVRGFDKFFANFPSPSVARIYDEFFISPLRLIL